MRKIVPMMLSPVITTLLPLIFAAILVSFAHAQTAVLFGATGAVGSEVLRALLFNNKNQGKYQQLSWAWESVILIGRKFDKVDNVLSSSTTTTTTPNVTKISLPNLGNIDQKEDLRQDIGKADACFIAIGIGTINEVSLEFWHSVEVDMVASLTRFCSKLGVQYINVLSAIDTNYETVDPYTTQELVKAGDKPLGWIQALNHYFRIKGLEERAVIDNASSNNNDNNKIPYVRLFRPSSITTPETRYGWIDWAIFKVHMLLDNYIPTHYHSVNAQLLGMAMVEDAAHLLQSTAIMNHQASATKSSVAVLTYADYELLAGRQYRELQKQTHKHNNNEL